MQKAIIDGYIVVTETISNSMVRKDLGYFKELIKKRSFDESLHKYGDVIMTFNHERAIAQGMDLELFEDNIGLRYCANIDDVEVIARALRGDLQGCSFSFKPLDVGEEIIDRERVRIIRKLKLLEVSLLDREPAYRRCSINLRHVPNDLIMKANEYRVTLLTKGTQANRL